MQRGYGNFLGALIRSGIPLIKSLVKSPVAKQIGKEALHTGRELLGDLIVNKKPVKRAVKSRVNRSIQRMEGNLAEMLLGKRKGGSLTTQKKRKRSDILGY